MRAYDGTLPCAAGGVPIRLEVCDWDFMTYPVIRLLARPEFLPKLLPHVSANGVMCYFAESGVVLDRFRPDTLGQASRIPGVTPAGITILSIALKARSAR